LNLLQTHLDFSLFAAILSDFNELCLVPLILDIAEPKFGLVQGKMRLVSLVLLDL